MTPTETGPLFVVRWQGKGVECTELRESPYGNLCEVAKAKRLDQAAAVAPAFCGVACFAGLSPKDDLQPEETGCCLKFLEGDQCCIPVTDMVFKAKNGKPVTCVGPDLGHAEMHMFRFCIMFGLP